MSLHPSDVSEARIVDGILARLEAPGGFDAFEGQLRGIRGCRRPVRLVGHIYDTDPDGRCVLRFSSRSLPNGVLLKACGTRRETLCPPCAALYRGDAFALVAAGLRGGKDVPEAISTHPAVLLTLTAPSFGPVHRQRPDGICHPRGGLCPHRQSMTCRRTHRANDHLLGQALCPDCYDYEAAILFNAGVSELWRRTTIYALRSLGTLLGLRAREAARSLRLSYVKVVEFQKRGSVHLHALVRADVRGDELGPAPIDITAEQLATALLIASRKVSAPMPGEATRRMGWGEQVDAVGITDTDNGRRRAAAYLAKYATKGSDEFGLLDHRLISGPPSDHRLPEHLAMLVQTAWTLGESDNEVLRLRLWAHTFGFRGHFLTKSRRYSTTFAELRAERQRWRIASRIEDRSEDASDRDDTLAIERVAVAEWTYEGNGYRTAGDVCLARNVEDQLWLGRMMPREGIDSCRALGGAP